MITTAKLPAMTDWSRTKVKNRRVIVRLDVNVPIKNHQVANDYRLKLAWPALNWLTSRGAKVIVIGHAAGENSLRPVAEYFKNQWPATFSNLDQAPNMLDNLPAGQVLWLENLRFDPGEVKNSKRLARRLAVLGELYVNEAFSASHRRHASIVNLPLMMKEKAAGPRFLAETKALSRAFNPPTPFLCLMGGAKFATKLPLVKKLIHRADDLFIGGALAHTLWHRLGYPLGQSLLDTNVKGLLPILKQSNLILPADVIVKTKSGRRQIKLPEAIKTQDMIVDAGPDTLAQLAAKIKSAKFILWNGPIGNFEAGFKQGTDTLAKMIAEAPARSIVGGGDTVAAIANLGLESKFDFVSTAGGAMLDFLTHETLPGIEALTANSD